MANPATHIIIPMLIVETYRRYYSKEKFSKWYVFLAGLFGAIADFDLFYTLIATGSFNEMYHRAITHSLLLLTPIFITGVIIFFLYKKNIIRKQGFRQAYIIIFLFTIGIATHVFFDAFDGFSRWFYPLEIEIFLPNLILNKFRAAILDGALLLIWILYSEDLFKDILRFLIKNKKHPTRK